MDKLVDMQRLLNRSRSADFLAPLLLRLYLAPVFWMAGMNKVNGFGNTVAWFGNPDWGLGLPMPWLMAFLAAATEVAGGIMLLLGIGVRWISAPLMITMLVAAFSVHWKNGWQAISDLSMCLFNCEAVNAASARLDKARELLKEHGNYDWLTESGSFVISNNGIEFAATYFLMLLVLFFTGGGKYISVDYWVAKRFMR